MKSIAAAVTIASLGAAALAGAGLGAVHRDNPGARADAFGGRGAQTAHVQPIWRERATSRPLSRVRCATAAAGDTSTCWAPA